MVWQAGDRIGPGAEGEELPDPVCSGAREGLHRCAGGREGHRDPRAADRPVSPTGTNGDLLKGIKIYDKSVEPRGPTNYATRKPDGSIEKWNGHPLFAIRPRSAGAGVVADYGSFESWRDDFLRCVTAPGSGVRLRLFRPHPSQRAACRPCADGHDQPGAGGQHASARRDRSPRARRAPRRLSRSSPKAAMGRCRQHHERRTARRFPSGAEAGRQGGPRATPAHNWRATARSVGVQFCPPMRVAVPIPSRPAATQREAGFADRP